MSFNENLAMGQIGESLIARWLRSRGNSVLPVYEKEIENGKGSQFFTPFEEYAAPDLLIFPAVQWIEAKHKSVFTWHRISQQWTTGIDRKHYQDYLRTESESERPVWLLFLHRSGQPARCDLNHNCPPHCPTGLFGAPLRFLARRINHQSKNHGPSGMVYWARCNLKLLASVDDVTGAMAA